MTNRQIAALLFTIATLLDRAQDSLYRVRAYRRAARRMLTLREEATAILARGDDLPLPGVGTRLRRKVTELATTGTLAFYEELLADLPPEISALLRLEGIGPVTAYRLYEGLGVGDAVALLVAAHEGRLRTLYGIGPRREAQLVAAARAALSRPPTQRMLTEVA